jgi:hypothetical protein
VTLVVLNVIHLNVVFMNVNLPNVEGPFFILPNVIMLCVTLLNADLQTVVAAKIVEAKKGFFFLLKMFSKIKLEMHENINQRLAVKVAKHFSLIDVLTKKS